MAVPVRSVPRDRLSLKAVKRLSLKVCDDLWVIHRYYELIRDKKQIASDRPALYQRSAGVIACSPISSEPQ